MILKTITVESVEDNLSPTVTVHYLKKLLQESQPGNSENLRHLFSKKVENDSIHFSFGIEAPDSSSEKSDEEWLHFLKSPPPPRMENVRQIHFDCKMALEKSNNQLFFKNIHFFVEDLLLFKIKSHPHNNRKKCFRIYTHPMTPEEIKATFIYDCHDRFDDHVDETYVYEGYDTDLTEDWSDGYDDYESDLFLDDGADDADRYAPPYYDDEEDEMERLLRSYACQTDFELVQPLHLPQSGISSKKLLKQMKISHDPFRVIPIHLDFFEFILQIYLICIETLRKEISRSDSEARLSPIISLVHRKKHDPSDDDPFAPVA
jgi:hypothetical protein